MSSRVCITFKAGQRSALKRISRESGAPFAELVRRAVDSFLAACVAGHDLEPDRADSRPGEPAASRVPTTSISD